MADLSFLADACALIAFHAYAGESMTAAGKEAMRHGDVFVSPITVWEITRKAAIGKLIRPTPPEYHGDFASFLRDTGYRFMQLRWDDCERTNALPMHHKDPMDRMLIATALDRAMTVITDDEVFRRYGVSTLW